MEETKKPKVVVIKQCKWIITSGPHRGTQCKRNACENVDYCKAHNKTEKKYSFFYFTRNQKINRLWNPQTKFVFATACDLRIIIGKYDEKYKTIIPLNSKDLEKIKEFELIYKPE